MLTCTELEQVVSRPITWLVNPKMLAGVPGCFRCQHCKVWLYRSENYWSCSHGHGRLISDSVLLGHLMAVGVAEIHAERFIVRFHKDQEQEARRLKRMRQFNRRAIEDADLFVNDDAVGV